MKYLVILCFIIFQHNLVLSQELIRCSTIKPDSIPVIQYINNRILLEEAISVPVVVHVIYVKSFVTVVLTENTQNLEFRI